MANMAAPSCKTTMAWRSSTRMDNKPSVHHIGERARLMALVKPLAVMAIVPRSLTRATAIARPIPTRVTGIMARTTIPATAIDRRMAITMAMVIITDEAERRDAIIAPSSSIARVRGCPREGLPVVPVFIPGTDAAPVMRPRRAVFHAF